MRRFVFVSSLAAAGPSLDGKPVGVAAARPVTAYGRSKRAAEVVLEQFTADFPVSVLRPPAIYGPRDREVFAFFKAVRWGVVPLTADQHSRVSMVHAADCAAACVAALSASTPGLWTGYVEDGDTHTVRELFEIIAAAMGRRVRIWAHIPAPLLWVAALGAEGWARAMSRDVMLTRDKTHELTAPHWVCDSSDTRRVLGWAPRFPFAEGARDAVQWYRESGWL